MRHSQTRSEMWPLLGLAIAVLLWGTSFVAIKSALGSFGPLPIVGARMLLASALMAPFWRRLPAPRRLPGDWKLIALIALLWPCLYYALEGNALTLTTASQAGTVSALVPLFVVVGARLFLAEHLSSRAIVGLCLSLAGVVALSLGGASQASAPNPALGNALEVAAMAGYAVSTLVLKSLTRRYNPWILTGLQCLAGAIVFLPALALTPFQTWQTATPQAWAGVLYLGFLVTLLPAGLYNFAVSRMAAGRAAIAINLVPVVALVSGWAILGDSLSAVQGIACAAVLGGVLLGQSGNGVAAPVSEIAERAA